jgi:UDP-N-acetylglucosamine acyltransferase
MPRAEIQAARAAYKMIFDRDHPVSENLERARTAFGESPAAREIIDFLSNREKRHYSVPRIGRPSDDDADGED